tara:strand:- start:79673 stop:81358 length:1686 start_codon:yes stop_codon:yes gene_type:complete
MSDLPKNQALRTTAIGIDLGTTRSVVAEIDRLGLPRTLVNAEGDPTTPSAVYLDGDNILVGKEAVKALAIDSSRGATCVKREIGNEHFKLTVDDTDYPAELVQSFVLAKLRIDAERTRGETIEKAVISVPAFFDEPKRRATIDAGRLAGLDVIAVVNEPTAAALAFCSHGQHANPQATLATSETVVVYDLGGGTFDVSLLNVEGDRINVIGIDGNARLGGLDWDNCLSDWLAEQLTSTFAISQELLNSVRFTLQREAEEVKHTLSARPSTKVHLQILGHELRTEIGRDQFDRMTEHLLDRTRFTVRKLLRECGYQWNQIDRVLLVGGSTRMPQVHAMLQRESNTTIDCSVSPDQAVAHGAAIFASLLENEASEPNRVRDVNAHHLGVLGREVASGQPRGHVMIPRNTPLPSQKISRFETIEDNQRSVVIRVFEGGDVRGTQSTRIGTFTVHDLPPGLPAGTPVDVALKYDRDGIIDAEATVADTGRKACIRIERAAGMTTPQRERWRDQTRQIHRKLSESASAVAAEARTVAAEISDRPGSPLIHQCWRQIKRKIWPTHKR